MYTQCPECGIYFRITHAQLKAREGLVRCGECQAVFHANERLHQKLPADAERVARRRSKPRKTVPHRAAKKPAARIRYAEMLAMLSSDAPHAGLVARAAWAAVGTLTAVLLAVQLTWLYRTELAEQPQLRAYLEFYCDTLRCELERPLELHRIELETSVAPHPRYDKALRLRAQLINRAERSQPFPRLEVALTNSTGVVVTRRAFAPAMYHPLAATDGEMAPNIAQHITLDLTHTDPRAIGYEVRLLPAR